MEKVRWEGGNDLYKMALCYFVERNGAFCCEAVVTVAVVAFLYLICPNKNSSGLLMYEMEIHDREWILHGGFSAPSFSSLIERGSHFFSLYRTNVSLFFFLPPRHTHTLLFFLIRRSPLTFSPQYAIPSFIMWGSMRQKESWVRPGPIILASRLSFSSVFLTAPSDRPVGNHPFMHSPLPFTTSVI